MFPAMASDKPPAADVRVTGEPIAEASAGSLCCVACGYAVSLAAIASVPECPNCHGRRFRRSSLFDPRPTVEAEAVAPATPDWVEEVRAQLDRAGRYLAFEEADGEVVVVRLEPGWTRIGRSGAADIRLDDATVSRRHALVVLAEEDELRALDDRSLNGLFVNGERVEWAALEDGDELEIGCYRLVVLRA